MVCPDIRLDSACADCPVFLVWVLLVPQFPSFIQEPQIVPPGKHLLHGAFEQILGPAAPISLPPMRKDAHTSFGNTQGGTHRGHRPAQNVYMSIFSKTHPLGANPEKSELVISGEQTQENVVNAVFCCFCCLCWEREP